MRNDLEAPGAPSREARMCGEVLEDLGGETTGAAPSSSSRWSFPS